MIDFDYHILVARIFNVAAMVLIRVSKGLGAIETFFLNGGTWLLSRAEDHLKKAKKVLYP